jgi:hypothetical protein
VTPKLELGGVYHFKHTRKGEFTARVIGLSSGTDGEWADLEITAGRAVMITIGTRDAGIGDVIRVRVALVSSAKPARCDSEPAPKNPNETHD